MNKRLVAARQIASSRLVFVPKDEFPILLKNLDVQGQPYTSIDVLEEASIHDHRNVCGDEPLFETWIGVTRFELLNKKTT